MECFSKVKVISVGGFTMNSSPIHDQEVKVKVATGEEFWVFDSTLKMKKEMIGKEKKILIGTTNYWGHYKVEKSEEKIGIKEMRPAPNTGELLLVGEVKNIEEKLDNEINPYIMSLDVGFGTILMWVGASDPDFIKRIKKGDIVKVKTGRLDLEKVLEDN